LPGALDIGVDVRSTRALSARAFSSEVESGSREENALF